MKGLWDKIELKYLPTGDTTFLQFDLQVRKGYGTGRFLGLAIFSMMEYMFHAKVWFIDATFHVLKKPFKLLLQLR